MHVFASCMVCKCLVQCFYASVVMLLLLNILKISHIFPYSVAERIN